MVMIGWNWLTYFEIGRCFFQMIQKVGPIAKPTLRSSHEIKTNIKDLSISVHQYGMLFLAHTS